MVQILFILVCIIGYRISVAQTDYVITLKGDSISGKVKHMNYGGGEKVQVTTDDGKKNIYSILQTKRFSLENELYEPVRVTQGYTYMKLLKRGYLSYYAFQMPSQTSWDGRYILKKDGSGMEVPNIGFKKQIIRFLEDCAEVRAGIESGKFTKANMNEVVDQYNACIDSNTVKTESEKKLSDKEIVWNELETAVRDASPFDGRMDAIEMITEVKSKVRQGEKIPNFLVEGIKDVLKDQSALQEPLKKALSALQN